MILRLDDVGGSQETPFLLAELLTYLKKTVLFRLVYSTLYKSRKRFFYNQQTEDSV